MGKVDEEEEEGKGKKGDEEGKPKEGEGDDKKSKLSHEESLEALKETRKEAAANRVEARKNREELASLKTDLAKALGVGGDEEGADVRALTKKVDQLMSKLGVSEKKDAFRLIAKSLGADSDLAWAYLMAEGTLDDPDADVEKALKKAMKEKPALKAAHAQSTGDPGAGTGGTKTKDMNAFIRGAAGR